MIDVDKLRPIYSQRSAEHLAMKHLALYNENAHMTMAKRYSDGELVYWKKQRDWFTIQLNSSTIWGAWWLLLDCPDPEKNDFLRSFINRSNSLMGELPHFDELFWIKDIDRFFELYFPYQRINEIIESLSLKGTKLSDFSKEDFKKLLRSNMTDEDKEELIKKIQVQLNSHEKKYSIVAVADILYKHRQQIFNQLGKPTEFKKWIKDFCKYFGITDVPTAKPSNKKVKDKYGSLGRTAFIKWCPEMKKKEDDRFSSHY